MNRRAAGAGPPPHIPLGAPRTLLVACLLTSALFYLPWRLGTLNPRAPAFSVVIYAAELFGFFTAALHLFMVWRLTERTPPAPEPGLAVDIFVPTINEPVEVVRRTLLAAVHVDYPHQTWLLDDGNRPEMASLATELGVRYVARRDNRDAKAGNLNHALARSSAEFIALFDADHAPFRRFLHETLGYFRDPGVAFVQTPQDFYNLDSYQHRWTRGRRVWTEQSLFFRVIQRGKDSWNAAFFCGSCAVLRRSALDAVGGFATGTVTEDLHTSLRLHKRGFRSVYHAAPLAFGIAPGSTSSFLRQRVRWGQGAMQVWRREGILFARGLTLAQRLNYLASAITYFEGWQKAIFYFAPVVVLVGGVLPIETLDLPFLARFLPYFMLSILVFEEVARGYGGTLYTEQYNMARFAAFAWSTLGFFRTRLPFRVTAKAGAAGRSRRGDLWAQGAVLLANGAAIPAGVALYAAFAYLPAGALAANLVWAGVNSGLAFALIRFASRRRAFRRGEYRFPVPLPARVVLGESGRGSLGTVDDISPAGFRFYGPGVENLSVGGAIGGELYLPSGAVPFAAEVARVVVKDGPNGSFVNAVGCRFLWESPKDAEALELLLFGSDLQWRLQEIEERFLTPGGWLSARLGRGRRPRRPARRWAPVVIHREEPGSPDAVGLLSVPDPPGQPPGLLSFERLPSAGVRASLITRTGRRELHLRLGVPVRVESQAGPVYRFEVERVDPGEQGEPAWNEWREQSGAGEPRSSSSAV